MVINQTGLQLLIKEVLVELRRIGFTEIVISRYNVIWDNFLVFANENNENEFSLKLGQAFLESEYKLVSEPRKDRLATLRIRAIHILEIYQLHGIIPIRMKSKYYRYADEFKDEFLEFIQYRRDIGICERTIRSNEIYLERFSNYLYTNRIVSIPSLVAENIHGFISTLSVYQPATIKCTLGCLRILLRFFFEKSYTNEDFSFLVPFANYDSRSGIPSTYAKEEVNLIISQIDRGNPKGKRDYAIILLAARLGLRASDICNLSFGNIRWDNSTIEFTQEKTKNPLSLPLLNEVGDAIIDYLKYGRPDSELPNIFLRHVAPIGKLREPTLHSIVTFYMRRAGIPINKDKKHGPHALRHSLAGILLEGNTPLPIIAGVLGHSDSQSTLIYLKIDKVQLKNCALEVPEFTVANKGGDYDNG
jgi:site-specific recombinase XerD